MRLNSKRVLYILIPAFIPVSSHYCSKEIWEGRIHQEGRKRGSRTWRIPVARKYRFDF